MNGVLIGVDESDGAAAALCWGVEYAARRGVPATALLAWTYRDQHQLVPNAPFDPDYGGDNARRDLEAIVARALGPGGHVGLRTVCGGAASAIIDASADASLVVVGARGMGGFKGLLVGSVSREVLNRSHTTVAVVREAVAEPDGPIVVGVDGSAMSRRALAWALDEARTRQCRLVAMHAWHIGYVGDGYTAAYIGAEELHDRAARLLHRELAQADTTGLVAPVERVLEEGPAAGALVDASATASIVVLGSRGHRPATGLLLGSVSDQVTHHAHSAVVVVPPSAADAAPHRGHVP
jgi:nucleotide-binding universal stress UspA family protein